MILSEASNQSVLTKSSGESAIIPLTDKKGFKSEDKVLSLYTAKHNVGRCIRVEAFINNKEYYNELYHSLDPLIIAKVIVEIYQLTNDIWLSIKDDVIYLNYHSNNTIYKILSVDKNCVRYLTNKVLKSDEIGLHCPIDFNELFDTLRWYLKSYSIDTFKEKKKVDKAEEITRDYYHD